jgi:hypothetical protein
MQKFKDFIIERFINLLPGDEEAKHKVKHEVYGLVQKAYANIGGMKGNGFESPDDMVKKIPMWKLHRKNGELKSVTLYKDKKGRKMVAAATDSSQEGKEGLSKLLSDDITRKRAYTEVSGPALGFLKKHLPNRNVKPFAMHYDDVQSHADGDEIRKAPENDPEIDKHPELKDHFYQRKIGGHWHTKIMLGTSGKRID